MVRVVAVVGGKHSGKTTVIQRLVYELERRGYKVGSVKEMPNADWIDVSGKETWRYGEAGAEVVAGVARNEVALFIKKRLGLRDLMAFFAGLDYLFLLEGFEEERNIVRIVAAKDFVEAQIFHNDLTIAISGLIAESKEEIKKASNLGVPIFNCITEADKLADLIEQKALPLFPNLGRCGECGYNSCHDLARAIITGATSLRECPLLRKEDVVLEVDGRIVPLKSFPSLFIKRTLIGMISSLNGIGQAKEIKVIVKAT